MPGESKHVLQSNQVSGYRANIVGPRSEFFSHLSYPETRDSFWILQLSKTNNALAQGKKIFTNITLSKTLLRELFYFKPNFVNLTIIHPHERISPELVRCIVSLELKYTSKVYII